ncbi:MAG: methyltransferase [Rhodospirillaceae bacterium]|nr:methyltransferase [Rhodospirillaceae bacterium]
MTNVLTPARLLDIGFGFAPAQTLLTAVALGLFTQLGDGAMTPKELGDRLGLDPATRARHDFFDALVSLQLLERSGKGEEALYRNTPETALFLDKTKPAYVGGILEMSQARLFPFWAHLKTALETGRPQNEIKHNGKPLFEELYADPARLEQFMLAMAGVSRGNFQAFVDAFNFAPYRSYCDVGGATGLLAGMVARAKPHLSVSTFDLPVVAPIATRHLGEQGLADRVAVLSGDFLKAPLPKADVISMGMILHDWNLEGKMHLIRAAYDALPEGGAFVVIEHLIDDDRRANSFGLMMSLNMLVEFGDAFDYTAAEFEGWCREVGFTRFATIPLNPIAGAAIAWK